MDRFVTLGKFFVVFVRSWPKVMKFNQKIELNMLVTFFRRKTWQKLPDNSQKLKVKKKSLLFLPIESLRPSKDYFSNH